MKPTHYPLVIQIYPVDSILHLLKKWDQGEERQSAGVDLGGGCRGCAPPPPLPEMTCGFLMQLVFYKLPMWFIGVEVEQETSAPPPKKNPGSAPEVKKFLDEGNNVIEMPEL